MEFLGQRNIYHGDLAARNILLTDELVAKVADFGLSKRLYQSLYSSLEDGTRLPMKWLALEILVNGKATIKCDIWSYGVLVWEIFELGSTPYGRGTCNYLCNIGDTIHGILLQYYACTFSHFRSPIVI